MQMHDLMASLDLAVIRLQYYGSIRMVLYEALSFLLVNRVLLDVALNDMYKIYCENGKNPKRALAAETYDCYRELADGKSLSKALAKWVPYHEYTLIPAGERSGDLQTSFDICGKIITPKQHIVAAILLATVYPSILMAMVCVMLLMVSTKLVAKFARTSYPETCSGAAAFLNEMSLYVVHYGPITLAGILIYLFVVFASLPYLRGALRVHLDKLPAWSMYRMLHASTLLLNVAVMIQANVSLQDSHRMMAAEASPSLRERLSAAFFGLGIRGNLGLALSKAGYDLPDKKAVQILMMLSGKDAFEDASSNFGDRWLMKSIKQFQSAAIMAIAGGIITLGVILMTVISGMSGIQDAIQAVAK
ncbi:type II secretion system F family protein [Pseudomonas aeruginosa]|uniref:type II secretion system F family protein n=1 Tax=Pseudomonas aeruginosa TaxID=287 RepID=UPI001E40375F|nr:type II secretion system F family protein [Pseudomonas aeruginosa]MCC9290094.1 type II secretion system F family protein [Pseudomonas aeruginosa]UVN19096.1 type II secretion system protein F [Pseudomonas aeruginosa]